MIPALINAACAGCFAPERQQWRRLRPGAPLHRRAAGMRLPDDPRPPSPGLSRSCSCRASSRLRPGWQDAEDGPLTKTDASVWRSGRFFNHGPNRWRHRAHLARKQFNCRLVNPASAGDSRFAGLPLCVLGPWRAGDVGMKGNLGRRAVATLRWSGLLVCASLMLGGLLRGWYNVRWDTRRLVLPDLGAVVPLWPTHRGALAPKARSPRLLSVRLSAYRARGECILP
jgi:hypothetical protein